jgi:hypothetical protein
MKPFILWFFMARRADPSSTTPASAELKAAGCHSALKMENIHEHLEMQSGSDQ